MRITVLNTGYMIAIDPSTTSVGWALYRHDNPIPDGRCVEWGVQKFKEKDIDWRLINLWDWYTDFATKIIAPKVLAIETQYMDFGNRARTAATLKLAEATGGIIARHTADHGGSVIRLRPSDWQHEMFRGMKITAKRAERKANAKAIAERLVGEKVSTDAADAICIGHVASSRMRAPARRK